MPQSRDEVAHYLCDDEVLSRQDDGRYAVTNLGALLLAKRLRDFPSVARKALRLVQYEGRGRTEMLRSRDYEGGYAVELEAAVETVMALTPAREDVVGAVRTQTNAYPERAVREILANALIHQDLAIAGSGPVIEVFADRVDFTNPGTSLVDLMRLVDNPPKSRNQRLASLMRRFRFCEELGTGWDRIISSCEASYLPAPRVVEYEEAGGSVRISLMPYSLPLAEPAGPRHGLLLACLHLLHKRRRHDQPVAALALRRGRPQPFDRLKAAVGGGRGQADQARRSDNRPTVHALRARLGARLTFPQLSPARYRIGFPQVDDPRCADSNFPATFLTAEGASTRSAAGSGTLTFPQLSSTVSPYKMLCSYVLDMGLYTICGQF